MCVVSYFGMLKWKDENSTEIFSSSIILATVTPSRKKFNLSLRIV